MLNIYPLTIDIARHAGQVAKLIAQYDADLARQLRRAATSVPLNVAEGAAANGGNRRQRYTTALGSAYEVRACLQVAAALDYIPTPQHSDSDRLERVIATLINTCRR